MNRRQRQRGVALITALLVVALATVLVAMVLDQGELALARTANVQRGAQASALAAGLEDWAIEILRRDLALDAVDSHADLWAQPLPPTPVPGGRIGGRMRDLGGCFNLNSLLAADGRIQVLRVAQFARLLLALKLDPGIADATADWIDADLQPGAVRGGEDATYALAQPPYRAANRRFVQVSELRLVRGVDAAAWRALAPHVCALPASTRLNINTATVPVLISLAEQISPAAAGRIAQDGAARLVSTEAVREALGNAGIVDPGQLAAILREVDVSSRYFQTSAQIELGGVWYLHSAIIERASAARIAVIARGRGAW